MGVPTSGEKFAFRAVLTFHMPEDCGWPIYIVDREIKSADAATPWYMDEYDQVLYEIGTITHQGPGMLDELGRTMCRATFETPYGHKLSQVHAFGEYLEALVTRMVPYLPRGVSVTAAKEIVSGPGPLHDSAN